MIIFLATRDEMSYALCNSTYWNDLNTTKLEFFSINQRISAQQSSDTWSLFQFITLQPGMF